RPPGCAGAARSDALLRAELVRFSDHPAARRAVRAKGADRLPRVAPHRDAAHLRRESHAAAGLHGRRLPRDRRPRGDRPGYARRRLGRRLSRPHRSDARLRGGLASLMVQALSTATALEADRAHVLARTEPIWRELRGARLLITGGTGFVGSWMLEA